MNQFASDGEFQYRRNPPSPCSQVILFPQNFLLMPSFVADQQFLTSTSQIIRGSLERVSGDLYWSRSPCRSFQPLASKLAVKSQASCLLRKSLMPSKQAAELTA